MDCVGNNVIMISEDKFLSEAALINTYNSYEVKHRTYTFNTDFTRKRKLFFFSRFVIFFTSDSNDHFLNNRMHNNSNVIGLCSVQVIVDQPNRLCVKSTANMNSLLIL